MCGVACVVLGHLAYLGRLCVHLGPVGGQRDRMRPIYVRDVLDGAWMMGYDPHLR